jgi:hypothetical protein
MTEQALQDDWTGKFNALFEEAKVSYGESRKRRTARTRSNILLLKEDYHRQHEAIAIGAMRRHVLIAVVTTERCAGCHESTDHVDDMKVWSHATNPKSDKREITARVTTAGMYDFHQDLPITINRRTKYIARCASCLIKDADDRQDNS